MFPPRVLASVGPELAHTVETQRSSECRLLGVDRTSSRYDQIDADDP
jgi:hypothetical protein